MWHGSHGTVQVCYAAHREVDGRGVVGLRPRLWRNLQYGHSVLYSLLVRVSMWMMVTNAVHTCHVYSNVTFWSTVAVAFRLSAGMKPPAEFHQLWASTFH
jgi:hypothetical protein